MRTLKTNENSEVSYIVLVSFLIPFSAFCIIYRYSPFFLSLYLCPSRSTRSSAYTFLSFSTSFSPFSSSLIRTDVVSWGQWLLDRILSRNIPVKEKDDDLSLSFFSSAKERERPRALQRSYARHVLQRSLLKGSVFRATRELIDGDDQVYYQDQYVDGVIDIVV